MTNRRATPDSTAHRRAAFLAQLHQRQRRSITWATVDFVIGTRQDLSFSGIKHPCQRCGLAVSTGSFPYPERITYLCEVCVAAGVEAQPDDHAVKR